MVTDGGDVTRLRGYEGEVERELGSCGGGGGELWAKPTEGAMSWVETGVSSTPPTIWKLDRQKKHLIKKERGWPHGGLAWGAVR